MAGRLWQMTKWAPGDWWLVSNDKATVYRFRCYDEDGSLTAGNTDEKITGTFWRILSLSAANIREAAGVGVDPDDLDWHEIASLLVSRAECVAYVEKIMDTATERTPQ